MRDNKIIRNAFRTYMLVNKNLKLNRPIVYQVILKNKIGAPSTFVINALGLQGIYAKDYSALFRICVVPLSHRKLRVFVDINCPLSPCPRNKYLVGKNCHKKIKKLDGNGVIQKYDKVKMRAFEKKMRNFS